MGLKNRMPHVAEPSGQDKPGPACMESMLLDLPVAGTLSQWESALGGIFVLHRVAEGACNPTYEFDPYLFRRFIPHDLKERYSIMLPMVAMLSLLWVTRYTNPHYLFLSVIPCHAAAF